MIKVKLMASLSVLMLTLPACVTWQSGNEAEKPPQIEATTPLGEALDAGVIFGDKTLLAVKALVKQRHEQQQAEALLYDKILANYKAWKAPQLINAVHLYQSTNAKHAPQLFHTLARAGTSFFHQVAWHMAAAVPSAAMAKEVDLKLTEAISGNEFDSIFWPKMAEAVANNQLLESYTVLRQGLHESNHVAFVRAMISLNPRRAAYDFMDYLARAPIEELRQLSLTSVDVFSCIAILQHYLDYPVTVNHPQFEHLFFYTISRNTALAEMARKVLESYMPRRSSVLALQLSRLPTWVQVAFVEGARRQMTPQLNVFLTEFQQTTSQREVIEEINNLVR